MNDFETNIKRCARRAAFLIRKHGWFRGLKGRGNNGELCAMMAIADAAKHLHGDSKETSDHVATVTGWRCEALIDPAGRWRHSGRRRKRYLAYWNDKTGQTVDNVLTILLRVANGESRPVYKTVTQ